MGRKQFSFSQALSKFPWADFSAVKPNKVEAHSKGAHCQMRLKVCEKVLACLRSPSCPTDGVTCWPRGGTANTKPWARLRAPANLPTGFKTYFSLPSSWAAAADSTDSNFKTVRIRHDTFPGIPAKISRLNTGTVPNIGNKKLSDTDFCNPYFSKPR